MGWISKWFSIPDKRMKVTEQDKALLELKLQRDKIKQYQKRLNVVIGREHELALKSIRENNKTRALLFLRKAKYQKQLLARTDQQLETLEELASNIEFSLIQKDVLFGLEQGNLVLKRLNAEMSLERVERIMDDSAEAIAYQQQVSDMLANETTQNDELEVEEEYKSLLKKAMEEPGTTSVKQIGESLPSVPDTLRNLSQVEVRENAVVAEEEEEEDQRMVAA